MAKQEKMFIYSNIDGNNNKFWNIVMEDDNSVVTKNGRVGSKAQVHKPKPFNDEFDAEKFMNKKINEKLKKGYVEAKVIVVLDVIL